MKPLAFFGAIALFSSFFLLRPTAAAAHDCWHAESHHSDYRDCDHDGHPGDQGCSRSRGSSAGATNLRTIEGTITQVDYLPGATPEASMVEVRLQAGSQNYLVRLGPSGFLKQGGLLLREGGTVTVRGFSVSGMEGDIFVATEARHGDKMLSLRNERGRPAW